MPHQFEPVYHGVIATLFGCLSAMAACVAAAMPDVLDVQAALESGSLVIMDDTKMRLICIIGAVGGGLLSALIFTPPKATGRGFALKVLTSSLAGILFTPLLVHWLKWQPNIDLMLGFSAAVALIAIGVIRVVVPVAERYIIKKFSPPETPYEDDQRAAGPIKGERDT